MADMSVWREIVTATAVGLIIGILLSWGAVYGMNRYLGYDLETTSSVNTPH